MKETVHCSTSESSRNRQGSSAETRHSRFFPDFVPKFAKVSKSSAKALRQHRVHAIDAIHVFPSFACHMRYREEQSAAQVQRTGSKWKGMCWTEYKAYFMSEKRGDDQLTEPEALRAWLRDLQGHNGVESYKASVLNRKSGDMEQRQFVYVNVGQTRDKEHETKTSRTSSLACRTTDFTTAQVQEAQLRVAALVSCQQTT